jgi:hypothetical protein
MVPVEAIVGMYMSLSHISQLIISVTRILSYSVTVAARLGDELISAFYSLT